MHYTVSTENFLTWALLKHEDGVSIGFMRRLGEIARANIDDCLFDVSANSIYAVVESSDVFEWDGDKVVFSKIDKEKARASLQYRLPKTIYDALENLSSQKKLGVN